MPTSNNNELTAISKLYEEMSLSHQKEREEFQVKMQEGYMEVKDLVEDKVRMEEKYK